MVTNAKRPGKVTNLAESQTPAIVTPAKAAPIVEPTPEVKPKKVQPMDAKPTEDVPAVTPKIKRGRPKKEA